MKRLLAPLPPISAGPFALRERGPATVAFDEALAASLDAGGHFRVLRRVPPLPPAGRDSEGSAVLVGIDLETTGLTSTDEVIECAMVRARYDMRTGVILGAERIFSALREPTVPLPEEVSRITGIWPSDLVGREIDAEEVAAFVEGARLVVAHNASFDRPFAERAWPVFADLPWACSCTEIDWRALDFEGRSLGHLVMQSGFFHDGHRACDDVAAMLHLLTLETASGDPLLLSLLEHARTPVSRVWAKKAPFVTRDRLKRRGYRWSAGDDGAPRAWFRDVPDDGVQAELEFLRHEILDDPTASPPVVPVSARDRFTDRAGVLSSPTKTLR